MPRSIEIVFRNEIVVLWLTVLLYAGGGFGERNFNLPLKPNRRTELHLTTTVPLA